MGEDVHWLQWISELQIHTENEEGSGKVTDLLLLGLLLERCPLVSSVSFSIQIRYTDSALSLFLSLYGTGDPFTGPD